MEAELVVDLGIELLDVDGVTFLDTVLFAAGFEYCVGHERKGKKLMGSAGAILPSAGGEFSTLPPLEQEFFVNLA